MGRGESRPANFVPLHVRSHYSLLDGLASPAALAAAAAAQGYSALALTDRGGVYGACEFQQAAEAATPALHPIFGALLPLATWTAPGQAAADWRTWGTAYEEVQRQETPPEVLVLAEDEMGWRNLCRLISLLKEGLAAPSPGPVPTGGRDSRGGEAGRGFLTIVDLEEARAGLIVLTGPQSGGWLGALWQAGEEGMRESLATLAEALGPGRLYLQVERMGLPAEERQQMAWRRLSQEFHLPVVATQDVRYLTPDQAMAHQVAAAIRRHSALPGNAGRDGFRIPREAELAQARRGPLDALPTDQYYLKSPAQMEQLFADWPEALAASREIAERCQYRLPGGRLRLPRYPRLPAGVTPEAYLADLCRQGLEQRFGSNPDAQVRQRLDHELQIIAQLGYAGYFLIVWDLVSWARSQGIPVGPGRGSAAGSLVAYLLGITQINPLQYGLIFERFLNPDRVSPPDIDIDLAAERRIDVVQYLVETYGREHVAQIITFGTLAARAAIREVGRLGENSAQRQAMADRLARLIPRVQGGISLEEAVRTVPELGQLIRENALARQLVDQARQVEGLPRLQSVHAAGVVIAPCPLTDIVPVEQVGDTRVTQWAMDSLEEAGLLKIDLLALSHLSFSQRVWARVRAQAEQSGQAALAHPGPAGSGGPTDPTGPTGLFSEQLAQLPLDDAAVYQQLATGENPGVFQFDSPMFSRLLTRLQPRRFEELIDLLALGRPGAMGQLDQYMAVRRGQARPQYDWPLLKPILEPTGGVILYQEQVMQIAMAVAGFTAAHADLLRRAMGKKQPEVMQAQRAAFLKGAAAQGVPAAVAEHIFHQIAAFAGYGFNKSHAAAYALLAYGMAWLLTHYPQAYLDELVAEAGPDSATARRAERMRIRLSRLPARPSPGSTSPRSTPLGSQPLLPGGEAIVLRSLQPHRPIDPAFWSWLADLPQFRSLAETKDLLPLRLELRLPEGTVWVQGGRSQGWPASLVATLAAWVRPWNVTVERVRQQGWQG
ncbi:MAG: DNA polymerase III subunit alpha [Limnochordaceae bacterium]|nr:DNA polymerase III subunit alpha [Limnochordaceae bacterium]